MIGGLFIKKKEPTVVQPLFLSPFYSQMMKEIEIFCLDSGSNPLLRLLGVLPSAGRQMGEEGQQLQRIGEGVVDRRLVDEGLAPAEFSRSPPPQRCMDLDVTDPLIPCWEIGKYLAKICRGRCRKIDP